MQKYLTLSDRGFIAYVFMFKSRSSTAPPNVRTVLVDSAREASRFQRELIVKTEAEHLETFREAGIEIIKLTPEQRARFEQASRPCTTGRTHKVRPETLERLVAR